MSIAELNQFIITAQPQSIKFFCTGKVTVSSQKKDGSTSFSPSVQRGLLLLTCLAFNNTSTVGSLRYTILLVRVKTFKINVSNYNLVPIIDHSLSHESRRRMNVLYSLNLLIMRISIGLDPRDHTLGDIFSLNEGVWR